MFFQVCKVFMGLNLFVSVNPHFLCLDPRSNLTYDPAPGANKERLYTYDI